MEGQLKSFNMTFGMSELFLLSSVWMYQQAFTFSIILLVFAILGKFTSYAIEINEKKEHAENGEKAIRSIVDTITNAVAVSSIGSRSKDGKFH